jgi:hypothetical protein
LVKFLQEAELAEVTVGVPVEMVTSSKELGTIPQLQLAAVDQLLLLEPIQLLGFTVNVAAFELIEPQVLLIIHL